jgi:hypothetical protein
MTTAGTERIPRLFALGGRRSAEVATLRPPDEKDLTHTRVRAWLRDLGKAMGFDVRKQLARAFLRPAADLNVRYLPYGELERNREAMARFGAGVKAIDAIAKRLS